MAQKPVYSPQDEQALMTALWSPMVADDLEAFVLFVYPWGKKNTPLEHKKGPRKWQLKQLRALTAHIRSNKGQIDPKAWRQATRSGRGIGKSAMVSWITHWMLSTRIGSSVVVSANTENQLRTVTWGEMTKWFTMALNSHWWELSATKITPASWLTDLVERDLKKGTRYWAAEGKLWSEENPDGYAGVHNHDGMMVIFDEASGIPDSIWSVASGFFTEKIADRYWFAFSNPRRSSGYFFECFNSKRDYWVGYTIDARTVEDTDTAVYEQIIDEYGEDSREARVEVYGEFPQDGDEHFISPRVVDTAMNRPRYNDPSAPVVMGIDPARGGADSTVIVIRKGRDITCVKRIKSDDTMVTVGHIIEMIEEHRPVLAVIDEGGLGYGILDRLKEQRYKVRGVNFGWKAGNPRKYRNKRSEIWGEMREWLRSASIPKDSRLKTDLTSPMEKPDSSGAILLESKKEMKARGLASPDSADAIAVTFAFPVAHRKTVEKKERRVYSSTTMNTNWMGS